MPLPQNRRTVLVVEDDTEVRAYLEMALKCQGFVVTGAHDGVEALAVIEERGGSLDAVILDLILPHKDGMETLISIRASQPGLPVIMISGAATSLNIVEAMKLGATDFIAKPINHEDLVRALQAIPDSRPREIGRKGSQQPGRSEVFRGNSPRMQEIYSMAGQIGWSEAPVLIQGETGVGKEVLARELHAQSPRANRVFLKVNCAALPSELVESELFGYEKGAFTGAFQRKPGMFEMADQGTIFLDEIGDMDLKLQAKLLQVLQDREFQRLGGRDTIRVNVRVIAATHRDLEQAIADGNFREDLYYRLNVITFHVPALRDCVEDIVPLADYLARKHAGAEGVPPMAPNLNEALMNHSWPGNIRELENVMRRFVILRDADAIIRELHRKGERRRLIQTRMSVMPHPAAAPSEAILDQVNRAKDRAESDAILSVLNATRWNRKKAAAELRIDYKALLYKMKKLGIENGPMPVSSEIAAGSLGAERAMGLSVR